MISSEAQPVISERERHQIPRSPIGAYSPALPGDIFLLQTASPGIWMSVSVENWGKLASDFLSAHSVLCSKTAVSWGL